MNVSELIRTEVYEWWMVFLEHKLRYIISFLIFVFLLFLFQISLKAYESLGMTLDIVTSEVDIVMDLRSEIVEDDLGGVRAYLDEQAGVLSVVYLSADDVLDFVDRQVVPGYQAFLDESKIPAGFVPLLRVSVKNVELLKNLKSVLLEEFPTVFLGTSSQDVNQEVLSVADSLLAHSIRFLSLVFYLTFFVGLAGVCMLVYLIYSFLVARKKEFHLVNLLGLSHHFHRASFLGISLFLGLLGYGVMFIFAFSFAVLSVSLLWQLLVVVVVSIVSAEFLYRA
jgi:cell division protein FtsX